MATLPNSKLAQTGAAAELPDLITVDQYRAMPDDRTTVYELHLGEVVALSHPKPWHWRLQRRLAADVAALTRERYHAIDVDVDLFGAPELVIEVKSPSNTKREPQVYAGLCLANGCIQFWILERRTQSITVLHRDGSRVTYGIGDSIPLDAFGGDCLLVAEIFA